MQPLAFLLHFLGGSARSWEAVIRASYPGVRCVAIDLPGFGEAAARGAADVQTMAKAVADIIRTKNPSSYSIVGHSMGAKVAMAVARQAEDGAAGLSGLTGLILLAGSPPHPEPMSDSKRAELLSWIDAESIEKLEGAQSYIRDSCGKPLDAATEEMAIADVLRANPHAWKAWLSDGSREDWRERIGTLRTPTSIVSGALDSSLGPDVQHRLMLPHFLSARCAVLDRVGHLLPLENPEEVASLIMETVKP